jgi:hypothetical protein
MEPDCADPSSAHCLSPAMSNQDDIVKMLTAISTQMVKNYQDIQERLDATELRLSQELHRISQDHEDFKRETRYDLQSFIVGNQNVTGNVSNGFQDPTTSHVPVPQPDHVSLTSPCIHTTTVGSSSNLPFGSSPVDFQLQMMTMLNKTFSKLSTVISDKGSALQADWPKFSGDSKTFRSW